MNSWPLRSLKGHISEVSVRKGATAAEILSVTNDEGFVRSLDVFDKQVFSKDTSNYKLLRFNDIAYNPSRINVGSVARCQFPKGGAVSPMYVVVRCRESLLPQFLLYFLKSDIGRKYIIHRCVGAVRFQLRFKDLEQFELLLPPVSDQERIVDILDEADALRQLRTKADNRTNDVVPTLFHNMFGSPPWSSKNAWGKETLGSICTVVTGNTPPRNNPELYGGFIEWVKTDDIDAEHGVVGTALEKLSEKGARLGRIVPAGSVLVTCIAGSLDRIGDAGIADRSVAINQQINALVPGEGVEPIFLWQLVRSLNKLIQSRATGVMTRIINKSTMELVPAICPPTKLQQEFAARVGEIRKLEDAQTGSRQILTALFQSLVQRAFAGNL